MTLFDRLFAITGNSHAARTLMTPTLLAAWQQGVYTELAGIQWAPYTEGERTKWRYRLASEVAGVFSYSITVHGWLVALEQATRRKDAEMLAVLTQGIGMREERAA